MRRYSSHLIEQPPPPPQERILASTHILCAPRLLRVFYCQQQPQHDQTPSHNATTLNNTQYKKDIMPHSHSNKLHASKTTMLHDKPTDPKRPKFIQLTLKPKSFKTIKIEPLTRSQALIPNHIEVLPILPLINCGECANCEQGQVIASQSHVSLSSNRSLAQASPVLFTSQIKINKVASHNITFSIHNKIFDDPPAMRQSLQNYSRSRNRKIFEPLNFGSRSVSLDRSASVKKKIFGQYSTKNRQGPIKTQEDTGMSDIPSVILSQWEIQQQIHTVNQDNRIPEREEEDWASTLKDED